VERLGAWREVTAATAGIAAKVVVAVAAAVLLAVGPAAAGRSPSVDIGPRPHTVLLPYAARRAGLTPPRRLVWGTQFMLEAYPEWHDLDVELELPRVREVGMTSIRTNLRWDDVEPENTTPEDFDWSVPDRQLGQFAEQGFDVLVTVVAYPRWATVYQCGYDLRMGAEPEWREFIREAALRYKDHVSGWEIGNEPDGRTEVLPHDWQRPVGWGRGEPTVPLGGCWGDRPEPYRRFVAAAYEEIKAVDPTVPVSFGSLGHAPGFRLDMLDRYLEVGGGEVMDYLGLHWFPDAKYDPPDGLQRYRMLVATMRSHGYDKPVWLTETYRLTHPEIPETEARQIDFVTKDLVEMVAQPEMERVYWYGWIDLPEELFDGVDDYERGLVRSDRTPKPALRILPDTMAATAGQTRNISTMEVIAFRFTRPRSGTDYVIAWGRDGRGAELVLPVAPGTTVTAVSYPPEMLMDGRCCDVAELREEGGVVTVAVDEDARFVRVPASPVSGSSPDPGPWLPITSTPTPSPPVPATWSPSPPPSATPSPSPTASPTATPSPLPGATASPPPDASAAPPAAP